MFKPNLRAIVPGVLSLALVGPAMGQADIEKAERELEAQTEQAIRELFRDLQLREADDEAINPRERLLQEQERVEELQRRLIELHMQKPGRVQQLRAAEPVQLDAEPIKSVWADRPREQVVAGLNDKDFAVRESAEAYLLTDNTLTKAVIKELISKADAPETRQRLLRVAEHHVLRTMRERDFGPASQPAEDGGIILDEVQREPASVGYSYEPVLAENNPQAQLPGVRVIATMPGFPGHAHLRRGDIIVQINGQSLSIHHREHDITNWVRWQISSRRAGDTIDFTVLRGGKLYAIQMVCAEGKALDHMYTTDAFEAAARKEPYQSGWEQAHAELITAFPKPKTLTPVALDAGQ